MKVLLLSSVFPNREMPVLGTFCLERARALARLADVHVMAPVPYFPRFRWLRRMGEWHRWGQVPRREVIDGLQVEHPRRTVIPKIGGASSGRFYAKALIRALEDLRPRFDFDVIDAHFAWPDGYAAVQAARHFGVACSVTLHGTDINLMPSLPKIRPLIRETLLGADRVIAVSQSLADLALEVAQPTGGIRVIHNGVDTRRFRPLDPAQARRELGLSSEGELLVSIGSLIDRKGHHYLIDAVSRLVRSGRRGLRLVILGEGPERRRLEAQIRELGVEGNVQLRGAVPHDELFRWLSATDLSCLCSSREGWPTVFFESWACGTPVVATAVHGAPEAIHSDEVGLLIERQDPALIAAQIERGLTREWRTRTLVDYAAASTWDALTGEVHGELQALVAPSRPQARKLRSRTRPKVLSLT